MGFFTASNLLILGGAAVIIVIAYWILQIIANWIIFTKAGQAGWKSIIPIYSDYISYKIAWQPSYFWIGLLLQVILNCINKSTGDNASTILVLLSGILQLAIMIIGIIFSVKLARAFGRGIAFTIGLIFLQPIFLMILAFGESQYRGADL